MRHMDKQQFINGEVLNITSTYKIERKKAEEIFINKLHKNQKLTEAVESATDLKDIHRLREYKEFTKSVKKDVYYLLRRYYSSQTPPTDPSGSEKSLSSDEHVSTRERAPYLKDFNRKLLSKHKEVESLLDVGGGLFPLTFPFNKFVKLNNYVWVDKDVSAYERLRTFEGIPEAEDKLILFNEGIGERSWDRYLPSGTHRFDLVLMLKLIGVVWRQDRALIPFLSRVPAKTILVTAPKEALTRKENIRFREDRVLKKFAELGGFSIKDEFSIENEFGYYLEH
jgi:hypothetical protein